MKKLIVALGLCFAVLPFWAQKAEIVKTEIDDFPEVHLQFRYRSPQLLDSNRLRITENGKRLDSFKISHAPGESDYTRKQIVILIENSYHARFEGQRRKVSELWSQIAGGVIGPDDEVIVADFDWAKGSEVLNVHTAEPTSDPELVYHLIRDLAAPENDGREHKSTEIFPALMHGIRLLEQLPERDSTARAILLFSSEFNNIYNNVQTKSDVIVAARKADIPIYSFRYPYSTKYDLKDLAEKTYGAQIIPDEAETDSIKNLINDIPSAYAGNRYDFSFNSLIDADGAFRKLEFVVSAEESFAIQYRAPSAMDLFLSKKRNVYFLIVAGIIAMALVVWGVLKVLNNKKKKEEELNALRQETDQKVRESEQRFQKEREELEQKSRKEQQKAFDEELHKAFSRLPRYPKLITEKGEVFEITKPVFTIGRSDDNDFTVSSATVSKKHALIAYDHKPGDLALLGENKFLILDLNSKNGTLLNDDPVNAPVSLNHNDLIRIGELTFTYSD